MVRLSIRFRLTARCGMVLGCILSLTFILICVLMTRAMLRRLDGVLDFEFEETAERLATGQPAPELGREPAAFHQAYLLRIADPQGRILAESGALAGSTSPRRCRRSSIASSASTAPGVAARAGRGSA